jgi:hypothetical protein
MKIDRYRYLSELLSVFEDAEEMCQRLRGWLYWSSGKPNLAHTVLVSVMVVVLLAAKVTLAEVVMKMMSNIVFSKSHTRC